MESNLESEVLDILAKLVEIPSVYPNGDTREICDFINELMLGWGYESRVEKRNDIIANVVATIGTGEPVLAFNCHIDTVGVEDADAWKSDPFELDIRDGRAYGLGANNCKGPAASQLWVAKQLAEQGGPKKGSVVFTFVGDEEALGDNGTAYLRDEKICNPEMLVVGAQTENALITRERGVMWVELAVSGKSAHAGDPGSGENAIMRMARLLCHLEKELFPAIAGRNEDGIQSTISIGRINGGQNINVVPSSCSVAIDRRMLPVSENIVDAIQEMQTILEGAGEPEGCFTLEKLTGTNGFSAPQDGALVSAFKEAIEKTTGEKAEFLDSVGAFDGRFYADDDIEIVNFGPGEGNEGHKNNESLPIDQLVSSALIQLDLVNRITGK